MNKNEAPFTPFVQKGYLGEEEGYLIPYEDLCKALRIPDDQWLVDIEDSDPYMTIRLIPKRNIRIKKSIMHITGKKELSTLRHKDALTERIGIPLTNFETRHLLRTQGNAYHSLFNFPSIYLYTHPKDVHFWFQKDFCVFVQKVEIKKASWERR